MVKLAAGLSTCMADAVEAGGCCNGGCTLATVPAAFASGGANAGLDGDCDDGSMVEVCEGGSCGAGCGVVVKLAAGLSTCMADAVETGGCCNGVDGIGCRCTLATGPVALASGGGSAGVVGDCDGGTPKGVAVGKGGGGGGSCTW